MLLIKIEHQVSVKNYEFPVRFAMLLKKLNEGVEQAVGYLK